MSGQGLARQIDVTADAAPMSSAVGRLPLIARASEFHTLRDALLAPPTIAAVEGETGVGKTTLVNAVLRDPSLRQATTLVGHCRPFQDPLPLTPVLEALAGVAERLHTTGLSPVTGALRSVLPELADLLPPAPEPLPGARAERQRLFRAAGSLLGAAAPTVLVVEDVHWMDSATEEFLRYIGTAVPDGVSLAVTFRPEDVAIERIDWLARHAPHVRTARITLAPFDARAVEDMAQACLGVARVPADLVAFLSERTAGLPFAVEEVLRLMQDRGQLVRDGEEVVRRTGAGLEVPPAVRDTVLVRLRRLSEPAQDVAAAAAVLASPAAPQLLAEVADRDETEAIEALQELHSAWVLREPAVGQSEFRHVLARQAVEDALPAPLLRLLHLRSARALERTATGPATELARHYREAGQLRDWVRCAEVAANAAAAIGNHAVAVDLLDEVLHLDDLDGDSLFRLAFAYGEAAVQARAHRRAADVLRDVLPRVPLSDGRRGRLRFKRACLLSQAGAVKEVAGEVQAAIEELGDLPEAGTAMTYLAYPWVPTLHRDEHLGWLARARAAADDRRDENTYAPVDTDAAAILMQLGTPDGWAEVREQLDRSALTDRERVRLAYNAAYGALMTGHYERARSLLELAARTVLDTPRFQAPLAGLEAWWAWATGAWDGLEARVNHLVDDGADSPTASSLARLIGASLRGARGDLDGLSSLGGVADTALEEGELLPHLMACGEMARTAVARGDMQMGLAAARRGLSLIETKGMWAWAGEIVPWAAQALAGVDDARADAMVAQLGADLEELDAPAAAAGLVHAQAVLAARRDQRPRAAALFRDAFMAWDDLPRPHIAALCLAEHGRWLADADRGQATTALRDAYMRLAQLGARWDAGRTAKTLRALGEGIGHRGGRSGYGSQLSPREREVARLARAGHTNRQIAEALVLSPRTVERHVASVLHKLGINSRREIDAHHLSLQT